MALLPELALCLARRAAGYAVRRDGRHCSSNSKDPCFCSSLALGTICGSGFDGSQTCRTDAMVQQTQWNRRQGKRGSAARSKALVSRPAVLPESESEKEGLEACKQGLGSNLLRVRKQLHTSFPLVLYLYSGVFPQNANSQERHADSYGGKGKAPCCDPSKVLFQYLCCSLIQDSL